ncbi:hypothetical protein DPMN_051750 [Dreissena polymorpha]|uniref:EGF-like domain-containing protein n=1 Tax=Dreissena polymorpha TaxID=45954 RepID=A0A9D4CJ56_DREPO|nr:hypothetical protein DPMN_051750 [Dreissena polymorpha]
MCQNAATCVDLLNAYECQCPAGYSGTNCEYGVCLLYMLVAEIAIKCCDEWVL